MGENIKVQHLNIRNSTENGGKNRDIIQEKSKFQWWDKKKKKRLQIKPALLKSSVQGMNKRSLHIYVCMHVCTCVYTHTYSCEILTF